jgi:hypothetical protein
LQQPDFQNNNYNQNTYPNSNANPNQNKNSFHNQNSNSNKNNNNFQVGYEQQRNYPQFNMNVNNEPYGIGFTPISNNSNTSERLRLAASNIIN